MGSRRMWSKANGLINFGVGHGTRIKGRRKNSRFQSPKTSILVQKEGVMGKLGSKSHFSSTQSTKSDSLKQKLGCKYHPHETSERSVETHRPQIARKEGHGLLVRRQVVRRILMSAQGALAHAWRRSGIRGNHVWGIRGNPWKNYLVRRFGVCGDEIKPWNSNSPLNWSHWKAIRAWLVDLFF